MRYTIRFVSLALLFTPLALAQTTKLEVDNLPEHPFQIDYPSGSQLNLYLRSGEVRVGRHERQQDICARGCQGPGKSAEGQSGFRTVRQLGETKGVGRSQERHANRGGSSKSHRPLCAHVRRAAGNQGHYR